jgi:hypothetical protein
MAYRALRDVQRMASHYAQDLTADLESWQVDHDAAMRCRDLEDRLAVFNGLVQLFLVLKSRYDSEPIPNEIDFDGRGEAIVRQILQAFSHLSAACIGLQPAIKALEAQNYDVEGSREFCNLHDQIQQFLREAKRVAKVEGPMGFHGVQMTPDAAQSFRALLDAQSSSPTGTAPS